MSRARYAGLRDPQAFAQRQLLPRLIWAEPFLDNFLE